MNPTRSRGAKWGMVCCLLALGLPAPAPALELGDLRLRGRLQARWGVSEDDNGDGWTNAFELPRARVDGRWKATDWLKLMLEVDLADGVKAKDAYGQLELHPLVRITAGQFKKPFSRLKLTSPWDLVIPERGLLDRFAVAGTPHGGFGGRDLGLMVSGVWDGPVRLRYFLGAFNNPLADAEIHRDYVARVQVRLVKGLVLALDASHKLYDEELEGAIGPVTVGRTRNLFGADLSWTFKKFTLQVEAAYGDNAGSDDPAAVAVNNGQGARLYGAQAIASYRIKLSDSLYLTPAFTVEVFDPDLDQGGDTAVRLAGAVNADLDRWVRLALSAEGLVHRAMEFHAPTAIFVQLGLML